jgi:hypothetical protein
MVSTSNDSLWGTLLEWIGSNRIGDLASILGIIIALVGFAVTVTNVIKSKNAARRAEEAARTVRETIRLLDTVIDFSTAISLLEEIKRLHRTRQWALVPDRCATIRKLLVTLRASYDGLSDHQQTTIQSAIANLVALQIIRDRLDAQSFDHVALARFSSAP